MRVAQRKAVVAVLIAVSCAGSAAGATPSRKSVEKARVAEPATENSCAVAKSVLQREHLLAPEITMLPVGDAFAAAKGDVRLVIACGLSPDETYTYSRVFAHSGMSLLVFKGYESRQRVLQQLSERLGVEFAVAGIGARELRLSADRSEPPGDEAEMKLTEGGLRELFLAARGNDPDLGRSQARVAASKADTDVARAGYRPRMSAALGISQIDQTVLNYGPGTQHSSVFGYSYDVSANMPLLHLQTGHNVSAARAGERGEEAGASAAVQNLIVRVADAYFAIMRARTDLQIARDELTRLKQVSDQAQAFLKAGTGDIIAVYEAQARLDGVMAEQSRAQSTLRLAEQKLSSIVGKPVTAVADYQHLQLTGPEPDELDWWLGTMEKRDPQIRQARESLAQMAEQTQAVKAERFPVVDATAAYDVSKGSAFLPDVETKQWRVGASVSVPIYTGGETTARIRRALANQEERRFLLESTQEQRRENLKQTFYNLRYNVTLIRALKQKEVSAEIQLNAVKKGRSLGTRTAIDLLNAEQAYSMAKRDVKNALYDNVLKVIQLKAAAGILDEGDLL